MTEIKEATLLEAMSEVVIIQGHIEDEIIREIEVTAGNES